MGRPDLDAIPERTGTTDPPPPDAAVAGGGPKRPGAAGRTAMGPGDGAALPAGVPDGPCPVTRRAAGALGPAVGTPAARDAIHAPEHDPVTGKEGAARRCRHADRRPRSL
jgi:uncharacterized cupin superfamily protein